MVQSFSSGSVGTNSSVSGPFQMAEIKTSMSYGFEKPNKFFGYGKVSAGKQFLGNTETEKNFNTKLYPTFAAGIGYNRTGYGVFGNLEHGYKEGVDRTTKVISEVGQTYDAKIGWRLDNQKTQYLGKEIGLFAGSETYSSKGHNRNYDNINFGAFATSEVLPNVDLTVKGGFQKNTNNQAHPAFSVGAAYHFGK